MEDYGTPMDMVESNTRDFFNLKVGNKKLVDMYIDMNDDDVEPDYLPSYNDNYDRFNFKAIADINEKYIIPNLDKILLGIQE